MGNLRRYSWLGCFMVALSWVVCSIVLGRFPAPTPALASSITQPTFLTVTRTLTPAEVKALHTTPITLIPAQGPNTVIVFVTGFFSLDFQTTPYTFAMNPEVVVGYDGTEFSPSFYMWFIGGAIFTEAQSVIYPAILGTDSNFDSNTGAPLADVADKAATIFSANALADGDSPVTVQLQYYVRQL